MDVLIDRLRSVLVSALSGAFGGEGVFLIVVNLLLLALGLLVIIKGGDAFVDAATWIAEVSGIPKFIVGATVVSLATTLPELLTSVFAASRGSIDMAIGNAVGSVTANIGLIMAISILAIPSVINRKDYVVKICLMLGAAIVIVFFGLGGKVSIVACIILAVLFCVNIWENLHAAKRGTSNEADVSERPPHDKKTVAKNIAKFLLGTAGIVLGAELLVSSGSSLASAAGVSERLISVTLIAVGTSLPELVTTITAIAKKQSDLSVGNIIGANIIDLTLILPICAFLSGQALPVSAQISSIDFPAVLIVGAVACIPPLFTKKFQRWQGVALLVLYVVYLTLTTLA